MTRSWKQFLADVSQVFRNRETVPYNQIPRERFLRAIKHPWVRRKLMTISIEQDEEGSHYHGILNTLANDCVGPAPVIIGGATDPDVNTNIEDQWNKFCQETGLGSQIRLLRRAAARTGIGIGIPFKMENTSHEVRLGLRVVTAEKLLNPPGEGAESRWWDGIKYNLNWEPVEIHLDTGEFFNTKDIILWWKNKYEDQICGIVECAPALCIFPSVKRYLDAVIRSAEFRSAIPMALKLDPTVWGKEAAESVGMPEGKFEYEPGMIPTLPPGTTLEGLSYSGTTAEDAEALDAMVGAAARCINMPVNLATGNSRKYNMASSQVDFGPWKNTINIDREDFAPVIHKMVRLWSEAGALVPDYFTARTIRFVKEEGLNYSLSYSQVFSHPDPQKISNSIATDLQTGATTLVRIYTERGRNPRREIQREADLLGITYEDMCEILLAGRVSSAATILSDPEDPEDDTESVDPQEDSDETQ
jgi:hypothetical protein